VGRTGLGRARHSGRVEQVGALLAWATHASFGPLAQRGIEIPFLFFFSLNSNSNIENSYLFAQGSKNYETGSVGFVIL
jgi:hypothetical protein